jgi:hypothetical protein
MWLSSDKAKSIASYCGIEELPISGVIVVPRSSATSLCNKSIDPFSADHIGIVKPTDRSDARYARFVNALRKEVPSLDPQRADQNSLQPVVPSQSPVTVEYIPIDFTPISETSYKWERGAGCECSQNAQISFPNGPYTVAPNEEFLFRYDGSQICRKQSIKDFQGTVDWGPTITRLHDFTHWAYWAIAGTLKVKF